MKNDNFGPSSNSHHLKVAPATQERNRKMKAQTWGRREGWVGNSLNGCIYLTDLCQAWCQQGWQRQQAPNWASAHGIFQAVWSCPRGSGCRCHDRQSNPPGKTPVVQGFDYLRQRDLDLAQYLLKIQLQSYDDRGRVYFLVSRGPLKLSNKLQHEFRPSEHTKILTSRGKIAYLKLFCYVFSPV